MFKPFQPLLVIGAFEEMNFRAGFLQGAGFRNGVALGFANHLATDPKQLIGDKAWFGHIP